MRLDGRSVRWPFSLLAVREMLAYDFDASMNRSIWLWQSWVASQRPWKWDAGLQRHAGPSSRFEQQMVGEVLRASLLHCVSCRTDHSLDGALRETETIDLAGRRELLEHDVGTRPGCLLDEYHRFDDEQCWCCEPDAMDDQQCDVQGIGWYSFVERASSPCYSSDCAVVGQLPDDGDLDSDREPPFSNDSVENTEVVGNAQLDDVRWQHELPDAADHEGVQLDEEKRCWMRRWLVGPTEH